MDQQAVQPHDDPPREPTRESPDRSPGVTRPGCAGWPGCLGAALAVPLSVCLSAVIVLGALLLLIGTPLFNRDGASSDLANRADRLEQQAEQLSEQVRGLQDDEVAAAEQSARLDDLDRSLQSLHADETALRREVERLGRSFVVMQTDVARYDPSGAGAAATRAVLETGREEIEVHLAEVSDRLDRAERMLAALLSSIPAAPDLDTADWGIFEPAATPVGHPTVTPLQAPPGGSRLQEAATKTPASAPSGALRSTPAP